MERINNWEEIKESGENKMLEMGGYICKITKITDNKEKQYLEVEFDIATGEYKNYFESGFAQFGFWGGKYYASYKEKAQGIFKHFITSIEKSNQGYNWNWDENTLVNKNVGIVISHEEYEKKDGSIGKRVKATAIKSVEEIQNGDFKEPTLIKLPEEIKNPTFEDESNDDLPF